MQDKELFFQLIGLEKPWEITDISVDYQLFEVHITVSFPKKEKAPCPLCETIASQYDHCPERSWRHLDTMQFKTFIHSSVPRIDCPTHGVQAITVPWSEKHSRFTSFFERLAIDFLRSAQNQTSAQKLLHLSWEEVHHIQEKAVKRGLHRRVDLPLTHLGVDEKNFKKNHSYVTLTNTLDRSRVLDVAPDRKEASLSALFDTMTSSLKKSIQAVAVDRWDPFLSAIKTHLPQAGIVHDKFHVIRHLLQGVDNVRKQEAKTHHGLLKGTKYLWLKNPKNWTPWQVDQYDALKTRELTTGKAWAYKELFQEFFSCDHEEAGRNFFSKWYEEVIQSGLKPLIAVAKMFKAHLSHIVSFLTHRITNAVAEGINSKIQQIKSSARGFRNFHNYRMAILFHCGGLNLYP